MTEQAHRCDQTAVPQGEEQFRNMADSAPVLIWQTDETGLTFVNCYYLEFFAQTLDEIKGMGWADFLHPNDAAAYLEAYRDAFERQERYEFQCRFLRHDGEYRWLQNVGEPHYGLDRTFLGFVGCSVDITDIKAAAAISQRAALDAFRLALTDALRSLADPVEVQATASRLLGEFLGANRVAYFEVYGADYVVERDYVNGATALVGKYSIDSFGLKPLAAFRTGRSVCAANVADDPNLSSEQQSAYAAIQIGAYIGIPLIKADEFVAGLAVHSAQPRHWRPDEVVLVEEVAERTWAAVERARAEAALCQSEEQTRNILESIAEAFFALDQDWCFTYVNRSAEALLDRTPGDLMGKNIWQEYPGLSGNELAQIHWSAMRDRVAASLTAFYPDHDRWYEVRTYPAPTGISVYFKDVTEQIQTEAALRESESRFRQMANAAPVLIWMSGTDKLCYFFNQPWLDFTGRTIEQEMGNGWTEGVHPDDYQRCLETYVTAFDARQPFQMEYRLRRFDGEYRWMLDTGVPRFTGQSDFLGYIGSCVDIDDRKQAEAEREQLLQRERAAREEAERANRIKDEFLAVLSHELRSPLNPILGWTRLMQNGKLDEARRIEALKTIERNAKLQSQLIEDLLDISRIMQGKLSLTAVPTSLTFVISAAVETVRLAAEAKHIGITLDLDTQIAFISGDAARLQQVVWNLLTNAVKFTPNGGQVTVELRQFDHLAQIRVLDTGKGINPQFLPHVFECFRQENGSITRKFGGLGLGLAIARQIVELHGGTVRAESRGENQGAIFIVQLPVVQQRTAITAELAYTQADVEIPLEDV